MRFKLARLVILGLAMLLATAAQAGSMRGFGDSRLTFADSSLGSDDLWAGGFYPIGAWSPSSLRNSSQVTAARMANGDLVVAGYFEMLDGVRIPSGIASWNGERWQPLGTSRPMGVVTCIGVYRGQLVVAGSNNGASCVAQWDGAIWKPLGALAGSVRALRVHGDDLLIAGYVGSPGGQVQVLAILRWDGTSWSFMPLAAGPLPIEFNALAEYHGDAYVSGVAQDTTALLARWNGTEWQRVSSAPRGYIRDLAVYHDRLIAAGQFYLGTSAPSILAEWNGETWNAPAMQRPFSTAERLLPYGEDLIVAGYRGMIRWNGTTWSTFAGQIDLGPTSEMSLTTDGARLIVGGMFGGGDLPINLAAWDGRHWSTVAPHQVAIAGIPTALCATDSGVVAAADFAPENGFSIGGSVGRWNGSSWVLLGKTDAPALAFATYHGHLVAAGSFSNIGGVAANYIAEWDGARWNTLGSGVDGAVLALEVYGDHLIAGGQFETAGGRPAAFIAAWDGKVWAPIGSGFTGRVEALGQYGGELIAGGHFLFAGDVLARNMARWNGREWQTMDADFRLDRPFVFDSIENLVVWNGTLVAQGPIVGVGSEQAHGLAQWDGVRWKPLLPGFPGQISAAGVHAGRLVLGGDIQTGTKTTGLLLWDGTFGLLPGSGIASDDFQLVKTVASWKGDLYVGGSFETAGGKPSKFFGRWRGTQFDLRPSPISVRLDPNPVNAKGNVSLYLDAGGFTDLTLFDARGREVANLAHGPVPGGASARAVELRNHDGQRLPAGIYFLRVTTPTGTATHKIAVVR